MKGSDDLNTMETLLVTRAIIDLHVLCSDGKEEKEVVKTEEPAKLQNGDTSKEVALPGASEEKKKAKTRFMFNIADGGFTG